MDVRFDVAQWQPTKPPEPGDGALSSSYVSDLRDKLNQQTRDILQHPYHPNGWLRRSSTLSRLRYPELAVGDAHKAMLLCQAHLARLHNRDGWRMGHRMGFWMQDESDEDAEHVELLINYLNKLQERAHRSLSESTLLFVDDSEGKFKRRSYPWMLSQHGKRSDELLSTINDEFASNSVTANGDIACVLKRHAFGGGVDDSDTDEVLGVFAGCDVEKGRTVLIDETRVWGCNGPGIHGDYANLHGGRGCFEPLHPNSETDDSDLDLRWIRDRAGKLASYIIRSVRLLLCSIQDGCDHPLDHPLVARLTPTYAKDLTAKFSLRDDIAIPNEALQQFGVDIFANHNYDTWILFTIEARACNNSCGDPTVDLLCPLFSLFNHSCRPNVHWHVSEDHQCITAIAARDIRRGEQMFVIYDGYIENLLVHERRKKLWRWLDGPCQCERCVSEEHAARKNRSAERGLSEFDKPEWDLEDKPVFPEDFLNLKN